MSVVGAVAEQQDRPAYVRFERRPVEDKKASLAAGRYVAKDVDYALITPPYSKDCIHIKVDQWIQNMDNDVRNGRFPAAWRDQYMVQLQAWRNGQELPPVGTPIRGWTVLSPAQQENLTRINILTLEDLAGVNDEGLRRIGMGALDLKNKAIAALQAAKDHGPLIQQVSSLQAENTSLKTQVAALTEKVELLVAAMEKNADAPVAVVSRNDESISADDILPESEPVNRKKK